MEGRKRMIAFGTLNLKCCIQAFIQHIFFIDLSVSTLQDSGQVRSTDEIPSLCIWSVHLRFNILLSVLRSWENTNKTKEEQQQ